MSSTSRIALVTGGNRGLGFEVCRQLARLGYAVLLTARTPAKAKTAAERLQDEGLNVKPLPLDVTDPESIKKGVSIVLAGPGRLDALVNNAAIDYDQDQRVTTADLDRVNRTFDTNVMGVWRVTQAFVPLLRQSAHGRIVNVSSESGQLSNMNGGTPGYSLSKLGLNGLTLMFANILRSDRILVNAICPGWVATDMGGAGGRPIPDGAASIVWGVALPDDGPSGGFFRDGKRIDW